MISTSCYKKWQSDIYMTYSISGDRGKKANYKGKCYPDLAPRLAFWEVWHNNIGKIPDEENNRYYVWEFWNQVLSKLDPQVVYDQLDNSILLCYEEEGFCHRHIVAAWFEILLGVKVPEQTTHGYLIEASSRPEYIKEYLEEAMRTNRNMHRFKSLRALYLYEKSMELEREADLLEEETGKCYDDYRQQACYLRCDADMAEQEYRKTQKQKILSLSKKFK